MFDQRTHFYCSFDLRFDVGNDAAWKTSISAAREWLRRKLGRHSSAANLDAPWFSEGTTRTQVLDHHSIDVAYSAEAGPEPRVWSLTYQHDDDTWHFRKWRTEISFTKQGADLRFALRLTHFVAGDWVGVEPALPAQSTPWIIGLFLRNSNAFSGGIQLREIPIKIKAGQGELLKSFLESKDRILPIVLISKNALGETLVKPKVLARSLAPLAFVCEVNDAAADADLSQYLPQEFRTFGGAVRVYLPTVDTSRPSDSFRHRYFRFGDLIAGHESVEAIITRAALRRAALQQDRSLVTISEVRVRNAIRLARISTDTTALVIAMQQQIDALKVIQESQFLDYCAAIARAESAEGELLSVQDDLKKKEFQNSQLIVSLHAKTSTDLEVSPLQEFSAKLEAEKIKLPIICIRSKQDPKFIYALSEVTGAEDFEIEKFIEEEVREHSSNLVTNLLSAHAGKVVLYAHGHLKYINPEDKKGFGEFYQGGKVRDAVARFMERLN